MSREWFGWIVGVIAGAVVAVLFARLLNGPLLNLGVGMILGVPGVLLGSSAADLLRGERAGPALRRAFFEKSPTGVAWGLLACAAPLSASLVAAILTTAITVGVSARWWELRFPPRSGQAA